MYSFVGMLENFGPLDNAALLLCDIADEANVRFTNKLFSIIASNNRTSFRFVAEMHIRRQCFAEYTLYWNLHSRILLSTFHRIIRSASNYYSQLTILMEEARSLMTLEFQHLCYWRRCELMLSASVQEDYFGQIDRANYFMIHSNDFRYIISEVSQFQNNSVCVTVTNSQVKFSVAYKEIVLTIQAGRCIIVGYEEGQLETRFRITLHPTSFFLRLSEQTNIVWFHKTIDNFGIIYVPSLENYVEYLIHFPHM